MDSSPEGVPSGDSSRLENNRDSLRMTIHYLNLPSALLANSVAGSRQKVKHGG
ncbi:MAG: hypothetical protein WCW40_03660 [Bacteroidota bacterium]